MISHGNEINTFTKLGNQDSMVGFFETKMQVVILFAVTTYELPCLTFDTLSDRIRGTYSLISMRLIYYFDN